MVQVMVHFFFVWGGGRGGDSLSPPSLNNCTVGNMRVMICLGQGGLRSLSATSLFYFMKASVNTQCHLNLLKYYTLKTSKSQNMLESKTKFRQTVVY